MLFKRYYKNKKTPRPGFEPRYHPHAVSDHSQFTELAFEASAIPDYAIVALCIVWVVSVNKNLFLIYAVFAINRITV